MLINSRLIKLVNLIHTFYSLSQGFELNLQLSDYQDYLDIHLV